MSDMGIFKRTETVSAKKVSAKARYVSEDIQRIDLGITTTDGEAVTVELTLDQVRKLVTDLTINYSACRPGLLDVKQAERIAGYFGMR